MVYFFCLFGRVILFNLNPFCDLFPILMQFDNGQESLAPFSFLHSEHMEWHTLIQLQLVLPTLVSKTFSIPCYAWRDIKVESETAQFTITK